MKLPGWAFAISYAGSVVEVCGAAIGLLRWRRIAGGQRVITLWLCAAAVSDAAVFVTAKVLHNSQPAARVWFALSVALALEALAEFQHDAHRAGVLRAAAGVYLIAWGILAAVVEPLAMLSTYSAPLHALVILTAAVLTLMRRASLGRGDLLLDSGFLVGAGLAGYAVASVLETLVGQLWLRDFPQYIAAYYAAANIVTALAEVVIIKALFMPPNASYRRAM